MSILKFRCTAETDLILNTKSASEGNNQTLDFIPGNCFLGIVANKLYEAHDDATFDIVHSAKVHFSDAHPTLSAEPGSRALRIPASYYHPKGIDMKRECIIHHIHDYSRDEISVQMKQCRDGFFVFQNKEIREVKMEKSFVIKSAYDRECRRAQTNSLYGYEFLPSGTVFLFEVDMADDRYCEAIERCLVGRHQLGRSKTAQFGLVNIERMTTYHEPESHGITPGLTTLYADGRLIFLDQYGIPTFQPTLRDLGLSAGTIRWDLSQIRTFSYAPWNAKRQAFDTDRCGIEKGSVIVVENAQGDIPRYIGSYSNEGFGKVIVNTDFLNAKPNSNGLIDYTFIQGSPNTDSQSSIIDDLGESNALIDYLNRRVVEKKSDETIFKSVQTFRKNNEKLFRKASFASQWGTIRSIAMSNHRNLKEEIERYISHGVKSNDWMGTPAKELTNFMEEMNKQGVLREALINLTSEMAKASNKKEK